MRFSSNSKRLASMSALCVLMGQTTHALPLKETLADLKNFQKYQSFETKLALSGSEAIASTKNYIESLISTEGLDFTNLNNPMVLIGFALTSLLVVAFILYKVMTQNSCDKKADLDNTQNRQEPETKKLLDTSYNKYLNIAHHNPNESQCEVSMYEEDQSSEGESEHKDNYIMGCGFEMKLPLETILESPLYEDENSYGSFITTSCSSEQTVESNIDDNDYTIDKVSKAAL